MADLKIALKKVLENEGFYSNDPDDAGGETIYGIARNSHKNWSGWSIVDQIKNLPDFKQKARDSVDLQKKVLEFYDHEFWTPIHGDQIINQQCADDLFDRCVNVDVKTGIKLAQRALTIPDNGIMDGLTLQKLNQSNGYA